MKQKGNVIANLMKYKPEDICISSITYAELVYGVEKSQAKDKNRLALGYADCFTCKSIGHYHSYK